jgi:hypothetical protein
VNLKINLLLIAAFCGLIFCNKTLISAPTESNAISPCSGDMEPVPIVLPKPAFVGIPMVIPGVLNLERPTGKPRGPFCAPKGTTNVALNKPVTSSDSNLITGKLEMITDGNKEYTDGNYVEIKPGVQWVRIDLGSLYSIYAIVIWHYHKQARFYKDVVVQVADDPNFITNVRMIFNNDDENTSGLGIGRDKNYFEYYEGKLIDAKGIMARYLRCYSNGNSSNNKNNYIEVEVYGIPAK